MLVVVLSNLADVSVEIVVKVGLGEEAVVDVVVLVVAAITVVSVEVVVVFIFITFVKTVVVPG